MATSYAVKSWRDLCTTGAEKNHAHQVALVADSQTDLVVRDARPDDAEVVARIYVDSSNEGFGDLMRKKELDSQRIDRWCTTLSCAPPARWWVALREGAIQGFVGIGPCRDPIDASLGEVDTIAVDPNDWRIGVGRVLMRRALEYLRLDGYREARLWTLAEYTRGAAFYEAMGWTLNGAVRDDGRHVSYSHRLG